MTAHRSPLEIIQLYWDRVYNHRDIEFLQEICADPIIRHDPKSVTPLSHEDQIARINYICDLMEPFFTHEVLLADETHVCSVWNMFSRKGDPVRMSGIEVFKAENGRFTDCWNSSYSTVYWGREAGSEDPLMPRPQRRAWAEQGQRPAAARTPLDFVELYTERVWNHGDVRLMSEICADPVARYEPDGIKYLGIDDQIARVAQQHDSAAPVFSHEVLLADDEHVCSVWNLRTRKGESAELSGIEVFRVENGRLTECWNAPHTKGAWGQRGDAAVAADLPPPNLLASIDDVDHAWMQSVFLHAGIGLPRIALVTTKPIGHGNMSTTARATIGYNQAVADVPQSAVCKFHSAVPQALDMAARYQPYMIEVSTYQFFGDNPPLLSPRVYFAQVSPDGMLANLVLEDLGAFCEAGDQLTGCGQMEAAAVVEQLARLHSHYWKREDLDDLQWTVGKRRLPSDGAQLYAGGLAVFRERYSAIMGEADMATLSGFAPLVFDWMSWRSPTRTLIHSDPRVDNIMFDRRDPDSIRAYIIDWQNTNAGDPQYDVAYFLTGSLSPEDRRACERALIADHATTIAAIDPSYTLDKAIEGYRNNVVSGLYTTLIAATAMPDTPHNEKLLTTLARRNCAAVRDWEGLRALSRLSAA